MTPEERKEWEAIRAKGQNYFLLLYGLPQTLLAGFLTITILGLFYYGFSLQALLTWGFLSWAVIGLVVMNTAFAFKKIFIWRKKEYEYFAGSGGEESSPAK